MKYMKRVLEDNTYIVIHVQSKKPTIFDRTCWNIQSTWHTISSWLNNNVGIFSAEVAGEVRPVFVPVWRKKFDVRVEIKDRLNLHVGIEGSLLPFFGDFDRVAEPYEVCSECVYSMLRVCMQQVCMKYVRSVCWVCSECVQGTVCLKFDLPTLVKYGVTNVCGKLFTLSYRSQASLISLAARLFTSILSR